jgi:hypothetical protein
MPEFTYTYDPRLRGGAGGYRNDQNGRIVPLRDVRTALDATLDNAKDGTAALAGLLRERKINLPEWQLAMRTEIKNAHIAAAVSAKGGWANMTPSDWGRVGQLVKVQYGMLDNFAKQIASGEQPLDGRFLVRSQMYTDAAINTHHVFQAIQMRNAGYDQERSILDPLARHCSGAGSCIGEASKGWQPIGTVIPIGQRQCLTRCRCNMEYQNSQLQEFVV